MSPPDLPEERPSPGSPPSAATPTLLEAAGASGETDVLPTVLEGDTAHRTPGGSVRPWVSLIPGGDLLGYRLLEPMRVASGEAELWLAERKNDNQRVVAKIYRWNVRPKADITTALRRISRAQVVDVFETGVLEDGRHYEILEYARHGSLADLAKQGRVSEPRVREILLELTDAISELQAANVLHRDIKPANILIRTLQPLDLVLTDFGISSISDLSLHATSSSRTAAYSAPEAIAGVVAKASDWWSVGVILLELLTGRHPFAGLDERAVNLQLVSRGIRLPTGIPANWLVLLKGLLTRDHAQRWGEKEVRAWLAGRTDLPAHYDAEQTALASQSRGGRNPYKLGGRELFDPDALAVALAEDWDEGMKRLARGSVIDWVKREAQDDDMINALQDVAEDSKLDAEQKLSAALLVLSRELPLLWRREVVSAEWLPANVELAIRLLTSDLPKWLKRCRGESWMEGLASRRDRIWRELKAEGVGETLSLKSAKENPTESPTSRIAVDRPLAERLILLPPDSVRSEALELRKTLHSSRVPLLGRLLKKEKLQDFETILLLACDRGELVTRKQFEGARQRALESISRATAVVNTMREWHANGRAPEEREAATAAPEERETATCWPMAPPVRWITNGQAREEWGTATAARVERKAATAAREEREAATAAREEWGAAIAALGRASSSGDQGTFEGYLKAEEDATRAVSHATRAINAQKTCVRAEFDALLASVDRRHKHCLHLMQKYSFTGAPEGALCRAEELLGRCQKTLDETGTYSDWVSRLAEAKAVDVAFSLAEKAAGKESAEIERQAKARAAELEKLEMERVEREEQAEERKREAELTATLAERWGRESLGWCGVSFSLFLIARAGDMIFADEDWGTSLVRYAAFPAGLLGLALGARSLRKHWLCSGTKGIWRPIVGSVLAVLLVIAPFLIKALGPHAGGGR